MGDTRALESPRRQIRGYLTEVKHPNGDRVTLSTRLLDDRDLRPECTGYSQQTRTPFDLTITKMSRPHNRIPRMNETTTNACPDRGRFLKRPLQSSIPRLYPDAVRACLGRSNVLARQQRPPAMGLHAMSRRRRLFARAC